MGDMRGLWGSEGKKSWWETLSEYIRDTCEIIKNKMLILLSSDKIG